MIESGKWLKENITLHLLEIFSMCPAERELDGSLWPWASVFVSRSIYEAVDYCPSIAARKGGQGTPGVGKTFPPPAGSSLHLTHGFPDEQIHLMFSLWLRSEYVFLKLKPRACSFT